MKILYLYRHSIKDGPKNTIGFMGLDLAYKQSGAVNLGFIGPTTRARLTEEELGCVRRFNKLFHGPQIQNAQTALAFCRGLCYTPKLMPIVFGFGDDDMIAEIMTDKCKAAVANGASIFAAIRETHGDEQAMVWGELGRMALDIMFSAMKDGEIGLGFFYGIPIMLTAWACGTKGSQVNGWDDLKEMEGLVFVADDEGIPSVASKISAGTEGSAYVRYGRMEKVVFAADEAGLPADAKK